MINHKNKVKVSFYKTLFEIHLFLLYNFYRELQQRIPNELLSALATSTVEGPIFEIVQGLTEVQNATEKQLFKDRLNILRGHSSKSNIIVFNSFLKAKYIILFYFYIPDEKLVFQSKYQSSLFSNTEPSEVLQIQENLDKERREMEKKQARDLIEFDKKIILKLDQQVKDQQTTLERAGVPGMYETDDNVEIKVQMHLLKCVLTLGKKR